ncbi:hypothetical protein ZWY2020_055032 [Hordeum vulgare]|nr:hypothetical protein ZWY2020_055032 [Hordeum vulgare]
MDAEDALAFREDEAIHFIFGKDVAARADHQVAPHTPLSAPPPPSARPSSTFQALDLFPANPRRDQVASEPPGGGRGGSGTPEALCGGEGI